VAGVVYPVVQLWDVRAGKVVRTLYGHTDFIHGIAFSPDGEVLATGGYDSQVRLWRVADGQSLGVLRGHDGRVDAVAFSGNTRLASAGADGRVCLWDVPSGKLARTIAAHSGPVTGVAYRPGRAGQFATVGMDGVLRVWDESAAEPVRELFGHPGPALCLSFTADGARLASGGFDRVVRVWDPDSGRQVVALRGHGDMIWSVEFTRDGTDTLASTGFDATVRLWRAAPGPGGTRAPAVPLPPDTAPPPPPRWTNAVAFAPGGAVYAASDWDGRVTLHDAGSRAVVRELVRDPQTGRAHAGPTWRVAWSRDGRRLATASWDRTVRVWSADTGELIRTIPAGVGGHAVAFSPDGARVAIGTIDGKVQVWDAATGDTPVREFERDTPYLTYAVAWSPDGRWVAAGGYTPGVYVWDADTGRRVATLGARTFFDRLRAGDPPDKYTASVHDIAFSPDPERPALATASWDKKVLIWPGPTAPGQKWSDRPVVTAGHVDYATAVAFSPDGSRLASVGLDRRVRFWDCSTGRAVSPPLSTTGPAWGVSWSSGPRPQLLVANWYRWEGVNGLPAPPK
jgi:WD40 repeat protein